MRKVTVAQGSTGQSTLARLVELKLLIDGLKPVYSEFDELLELVLDGGIAPEGSTVRFGGATWSLLLVDRFAKKNTVWKSAVQRRFDLEISRHMVAAPKNSIFKTRKGKKR